jgi:hypothetical protein
MSQALFYFSFFLYLFIYCGAGDRARALHMLGKCSSWAAPQTLKSSFKHFTNIHSGNPHCSLKRKVSLVDTAYRGENWLDVEGIL